MERLKRKEFYVLGNLLGLAILYGCAGPRYLMPAVVSKIFFQKITFQLFIHDVPDFEIQQKLIKVDNSKTETDFQKAINIDEFPERFDAVSKSSVKLEEKNSFIQNIIEHFIICRCSEEILDVASGMDIHDLHSVLLCHSEEVFSEFSLGEKSKPSSEDVIKIFSEIDYHKESEEIRKLQGDFYYNITNFVQSIEDEPFILSVLNIDGEKEISQKKEVTLSDFVKFISGSRFVLPSMIGNCKLKFAMPDECEKGERVFISICQLLFKIPLNERYCVDTEDFNRALLEDICDSPGFGKE
eukprot:TCONS_00050996-protein